MIMNTFSEITNKKKKQKRNRTHVGDFKVFRIDILRPNKAQSSVKQNRVQYA